MVCSCCYPRILLIISVTGYTRGLLRWYKETPYSPACTKVGCHGIDPSNFRLNFWHIPNAPPLLAGYKQFTVLQFVHINPLMFSITPSIYRPVLWQKFTSLLTSNNDTSWGVVTMTALA